MIDDPSAEARRLERSAENAPSSESLHAEQPAAVQAEEVERRANLLALYKAATDNPSNRQIYTAKNSNIHKPQFYQWQKGLLPAPSKTCVNFERFLREKMRPVPRNPPK